MAPMTNLLGLPIFVSISIIFGSHRCAATDSLPYALEPEESSLVVIGAHHFGSDRNDPEKFFTHVFDMPWQSTILVEANPVIADELEALVQKKNPTPNAAEVRVVKEGVVPGGSDVAAQTLNFFSLDEEKLPRLPWWTSQIGSFDRKHLEKHIPKLSMYPPEVLDSHIVNTSVLARPMEPMLKLAGVKRIGILIIDTEGLDCRIVSSQNWSSPEVCSWRPNILYFERVHCSDSEYEAAHQALLDIPRCEEGQGRRTGSQYIAINEEYGGNKYDYRHDAVYALKPTGGWTYKMSEKWFGGKEGGQMVAT